MMRRLKDLISAHESDLGGEDYVSESERRIVRRAAMLTIQLEMLDARALPPTKAKPLGATAHVPDRQ